MITSSLLLVACQKSSGQDELQKQVITKTDSIQSTVNLPERNKIKVADKFNFPVGQPDGKGYYKAQNHGDVNKSFGGNLHLGEDWNGIGGGNTDLGDTVYAIANGKINYSDDAGPGWGNVIKISHLVSGDTSYYVESLYGHLNERFVSVDSIVEIGTPIGTIGNAGGTYLAHLHLELRSGKNNPVGGGYTHSLPPEQLNPTQFIKSHRTIPIETR